MCSWLDDMSNLIQFIMNLTFRYHLFANVINKTTNSIRVHKIMDRGHDMKGIYHIFVDIKRDFCVVFETTW